MYESSTLLSSLSIYISLITAFSHFTSSIMPIRPICRLATLRRSSDMKLGGFIYLLIFTSSMSSANFFVAMGSAGWDSASKGKTQTHQFSCQNFRSSTVAVMSVHCGLLPNVAFIQNHPKIPLYCSNKKRSLSCRYENPTLMVKKFRTEVYEPFDCRFNSGWND